MVDIFVAGSLDSGVQGRGPTEVPPQADVFYWREAAGDFSGFVCRSVIYYDDFKSVVVFITDLNNLLVKPGDIVLLVENRHNNGEGCFRSLVQVQSPFTESQCSERKSYRL